MPRGRPIRKRKSRKRFDSVLIGTEALFLLVLVLAVAAGGMRALSGLPALGSMLMPQGIMAAEAGLPDNGRVGFSVTLAGTGELHAPQVLRAGDGFPQWLRARIAIARATGTAGVIAVPKPVPEIAIVIDDLGADAVNTRRAIALPKEVSLSFLPYPEAAPQLAREALRAGHQILVHVPMEPDGRTDPGPNALLTSLSSAANISRLDWDLARIPGFVGINNHEGSRFTADREALIPVIEHLADRHVFFLDSRTSADTQVVTLARALGVQSAGRDVFLDDVQTPGAIASELAHAETVAKEQGVAIAIGHPHPVTMDALARWAAAAKSRGFALIAASDAIRMKTERDIRSLSAAR